MTNKNNNNKLAFSCLWLFKSRGFCASGRLPGRAEVRLDGFGSGLGLRAWGLGWVAVKELKLSYYIGETLLFTIYIYIYPLW